MALDSGPKSLIFERNIETSLTTGGITPSCHQWETPMLAPTPLMANRPSKTQQYERRKCYVRRGDLPCQVNFFIEYILALIIYTQLYDPLGAVRHSKAPF